MVPRVAAEVGWGSVSEIRKGLKRRKKLPPLSAHEKFRREDGCTRTRATRRQMKNGRGEQGELSQGWKLEKRTKRAERGEQGLTHVAAGGVKKKSTCTLPRDVTHLSVSEIVEQVKLSTQLLGNVAATSRQNNGCSGTLVNVFQRSHASHTVLDESHTGSEGADLCPTDGRQQREIGKTQRSLSPHSSTRMPVTSHHCRSDKRY